RVPQVKLAHLGRRYVPEIERRRNDPNPVIEVELVRRSDESLDLARRVRDRLLRDVRAGVGLEDLYALVDRRRPDVELLVRNVRVVDLYADRPDVEGEDRRHVTSCPPTCGSPTRTGPSTPRARSTGTPSILRC